MKKNYSIESSFTKRNNKSFSRHDINIFCINDAITSKKKKMTDVPKPSSTKSSVLFGYIAIAMTLSPQREIMTIQGTRPESIDDLHFLSTNSDKNLNITTT